MAPSRKPREMPPGMARQRTELAWSRTVIAFAAVGGALLKTQLTAGLIVVGMGVLVWGLSRLFPGPETGNTARGRLLVVTAGVTGVALVALVVAFL